MFHHANADVPGEPVREQRVEEACVAADERPEDSESKFCRHKIPEVSW
ncbi:MAG TPA: hypothetical protein VGF16_17980 [Bryobacteraceae bacterium]|jgi:hypothetical protein